MYLGLDTVELKDEGFELLVAEGGQVGAGRPLLRWNPAAIEADGRSPVCPVVALDADPDLLSEVRASGDVVAGDELFTWS